MLQVCGGGSPTELITALRYVQAPSSPSAAKQRLLSDGEANVCRLNDSRTVIRKIMNSRCLRRWETHHLVLGPVELYSTTVSAASPRPCSRRSGRGLATSSATDKSVE